MTIRKNLTYPSRDGISQCHACIWEPEDGQIKGILQIVHGMQEYIERYDAFADFMCNNGFMVVGNDHLGHGHTAATEKDLGYFAEKNADTIVVRDVHRLKKITEEGHPGIPYFLLGHSMGSFITRKYITMYGKGINGAILAGTGAPPRFVTKFGIFLTNILTLFHGERYESRFIDNLAFHAYNKRIEDVRTKSDWICRDTDVVDKYVNDPLCNFNFSLNGFHTLFSLINYVTNPKKLTTIPKELPIYLIAGDGDPVGNYGKDPVNVAKSYINEGIRDVELKIYPEYRHELLNELNHQVCFDDILNWLVKHL